MPLTGKRGRVTKIKTNDCLLYIGNSVEGDIIRVWFGECVCGCVRLWVHHVLPCRHDSDYSFCQINLKLWMIRRGTLLNFGLNFKVKFRTLSLEQVCKTLWAQYRLQF